MSVIDDIMQEINSASRRMCTNEIPMKYYRAIGTRKVEEIIRRHLSGEDTDVPANSGWIPVSEQLPETDDYILLSFSNFSLPMVGRYEKDSNGGVFYLGDCDEEDTCISQNLFVNAWMPLPEPYREEKDVGR